MCGGRHRFVHLLDMGFNDGSNVKLNDSGIATIMVSVDNGDVRERVFF